MFDGAGLALFAVAGTQKALGYGFNPVMAPLLGMLTGIGGGMLRDLLLAQIPTVLRAELYVVFMLAGAVVVMVSRALHLQPTAMPIAGAATRDHGGDFRRLLAMLGASASSFDINCMV